MAFTDHDTASDPAALAEALRLNRGVRVTPVIAVGEEVVVGFDEPRLRRLLGLEG
ncbi:MAG: hypothetical protein HYV08_02610 [Deltaproteobacteria bacterium]|nr:hypothetical protein [Deltaproteobacteria bacterium]MBI3079644.1 hypothetical protein [Deltaproteobacteria bacterium]